MKDSEFLDKLTAERKNLLIRLEYLNSLIQLYPRHKEIKSPLQKKVFDTISNLTSNQIDTYCEIRDIMTKLNFSQSQVYYAVRALVEDKRVEKFRDSFHKKLGFRVSKNISG